MTGATDLDAGIAEVLKREGVMEEWVERTGKVEGTHGRAGHRGNPDPRVGRMLMEASGFVK